MLPARATPSPASCLSFPRSASPDPLPQDQIPQDAAVSAATSGSLPASATLAAAVRPNAHMVSSAGDPVTVTTGARALAMIRTGPAAAPSAPVVADQLHPDRRLAQHQPGQPQPPPQQLRQPRIQVPRRPARLGPPDVLVVHEELDGVGLGVRAGDGEQRQPGRPGPDQLDQAGERGPARQLVLEPAGAGGQRPAQHPEPGVRAALAQHQVRGQVGGAPALAERGLVRAEVASAACTWPVAHRGHKSPA